MITIFGGPKTIRGQYFLREDAFKVCFKWCGLIFRVIVRDEIVCDKSVCVCEISLSLQVLFLDFFSVL